MAKYKKVWVLKYKVHPPKTIGYHSGTISIGGHKDRTVDQVMNTAKSRVKSQLLKNGIEIEDQSKLELTVDITYTM